MPRAGFYNDNEYRDYPFQTVVEPLEYESSASAVPFDEVPHELIVDFGVVMDAHSGWSDTAGHTVWLRRIERCSDVFVFEFRYAASEVGDEALIFARSITAEEFQIEWAESLPLYVADAVVCGAAAPAEIPGWDMGAFEFVEGSVGESISLSSEGPCPRRPKWTGFMVTGKLDELILLMPSDDVMVFEAPPYAPYVMEPGRIQSLVNAYVHSISLANFPRTLALTTEECDSSASQDDDLVVNYRCLQGVLAFKEGYNCSIEQDDTQNAIIIDGATGAGAGVPCEEVPLTDDEVAPDDNTLLTGGPGCGEIVKTINGKGARRLQLLAGRGIRIYADPTRTDTLIIDRDLSDFALCLDEDSSESV